MNRKILKMKTSSLRLVYQLANHMTKHCQRRLQLNLKIGVRKQKKVDKTKIWPIKTKGKAN